MSSTRPPSALPPGTVVQGYRVEGLLGRGGMGAVYRAAELRSGRAVALKLLHGQPSPAQLERFRREGAVTAALRHPGIVPVHAAGEVHGQPFIAYALVEGAQPLDAVLRERDLQGRVQLVLEAARALAHAHAHGVVHRDVKPDNLLVDGSGQVRVADFGLAQVDDGRHLTRTGAVLGTPTHMAPEQFEAGEVGPPADVWALGVVLFQALTHSLPFMGDNLLELRAQQLQRSRSPRALDPGIPRPLDAICQRALAVDAAQRYPHAGAFAEDLGRWLRGESVQAGASAGERLQAATRRLRWGLALIPALALIAWAARPPAQPAPTAAPPPTRAAASSPPDHEPPARRRELGWDLRPGDRLELEFGWQVTRVHDDPQRPEDTYAVDLRAAATVPERASSFANVALRVAWIHLRSGSFDSTPERPHPLLPIAPLLGETFNLHLEQPSGHVRRVLGVRALRERMIEGTLREARATVDQALDTFNDVTVERNMNTVSLGPGEGESLETGWSRDVEVWLTGDFGFRHPVRLVQDGPGRMVYRSEQGAPTSGSVGQLEEPRLEGWLELEDGLIKRAEATQTGHLKTPKLSCRQTLTVTLTARRLPASSR